MVIKFLKYLLDLLSTYRWWVFGVIYAFGAGVYYIGCGATKLEAAYNALALFAMSINTKSSSVSVCNSWLYVAGLLAAFYTAISVISLVAKRFIDKQEIVNISKSSYILVCGLGEKASAYIDSELEDNKSIKILAIEKDINNPNIEKYRAKGIAVKVADAKNIETLRTLNIKNAKHIVVLAGKDTDNLEIALALKEISIIYNLAIKKLYMHIDDRGLDKFYKDGGLLDDSAKLEVKMFSMSRNGAKALFLDNFVDGESQEFVNSNKPFSLVVAGHSRVSLEVVGQICELAHLPNENRVTIYCISDNSELFKSDIEYRYTNIDKIPNINIEYISLNYNKKSFYEHTLWQEDITNIVLCYDDAQINLNIAAELADSTYLQAIADNSLKTKIHIAIYNNKLLAYNINRNEAHFKYFDVFAQTALMASKKMIIDEKFETIAKCIHAGYEMRYNVDAMFSDDKAIQSAWQNSKGIKLSDRVSNRAQAYHIPIKLKAMGLGFKESTLPIGKLLIHNQKMFAQTQLYKELKNLKLNRDGMYKRTIKLVGDNSWNTKDFNYFPDTYSNLIEKLIRAEHNRWNAHHWLKGWEHNKDKTNKQIKQHRCLVPMNKMDKRDKHTIIYDIYSVLYIPNLLAKAGYELVENKDASI